MADDLNTQGIVKMHRKTRRMTVDFDFILVEN